MLEKHKSSFFDAPANYVAIFCFAILPFSGIIPLIVLPILFIFESKSDLVKYQSAQALLLWAVASIIKIGFSILSLIFGTTQHLFNFMFFSFSIFSNTSRHPILRLFRSLGALAYIAICAYVIFQLYRWNNPKLPVIGSIAEKIVKNGSTSGTQHTRTWNYDSKTKEEKNNQSNNTIYNVPMENPHDHEDNQKKS